MKKKKMEKTRNTFCFSLRNETAKDFPSEKNLSQKPISVWAFLKISFLSLFFDFNMTQKAHLLPVMKKEERKQMVDMYE